MRGSSKPETLRQMLGEVVEVANKLVCRSAPEVEMMCELMLEKREAER